jgi:biotin carboxyl carrier protein
VLRNLLVAVFILIIATAALWLLLGEAPAQGARDRVRPSPLVSTLTAAVIDAPLSLSAHGTAVPGRRATMRAEVSGRVASGHWRSGDLVPDAASLLTIDAPGVMAAQAVMAAEVAQLQAEIALLDQTLAYDRELLAIDQDDLALTAQALADETELQRDGISNERRREERQAAHNRARRSVAQRRLQIDDYPHRRAVALARLAAAQARLTEAEATSAKCQLQAQWSAVVVAAHVEPGDAVLPGQALLTLASLDRAEVRAPISPARLATVLGLSSLPFGALPVDVSATFSVGALTYEGRVVRIEAALDANTREVVAVIGITPADDQPPIYQDLFGEVVIYGPDQPTLRLPLTALRDDGSVYVVVDERLQRRQPTLLHRHQDMAIIADDGVIAPGDQVVTTLLDTAHDGMAVRLAEPITP